MVMINWRQDFVSYNSVVIILLIKQIRLPLRGLAILLITRMITDQIELHSGYVNTVPDEFSTG